MQDILQRSGATMAEMDEVINHLITSKNITIDEAKHYLKTKKHDDVLFIVEIFI